MVKKLIKIGLGLVGIGVVVFLLIQLVPYGKDKSNPPVVKEPAWDSPATREIAARACFDCHSSQTKWPWYSNVAPMSWLVYKDVVDARAVYSFSDWQGMSSNSLVRVIENGSMPPPQYLMLHPEAQLSKAEKDAFIKGLKATLDKK